MYILIPQRNWKVLHFHSFALSKQSVHFDENAYNNHIGPKHFRQNKNHLGNSDIIQK